MRRTIVGIGQSGERAELVRVDLGDDGQVTLEYLDPEMRYELEEVGLVLDGRKVRPRDGVDFWNALPKAYRQSSYVTVVDG